MCYINGLLFLIFGASGVAIANNPWVIAIGIILTIAGFWWMWRAYAITWNCGHVLRYRRVDTL